MTRSLVRWGRNPPRDEECGLNGASLPDGEIDLYRVEEGRPGTLSVYRKSYDAYDDRWSGERRLRSISY